MKKLLLFALMTLSTLFSACLFEDDEEEWDAAKVCPEAGTNAYGDPNRGTFVDERDGRVYKYTTIGDQVWMAENLKFELPYPYSLCYGMEVCKEEWWEDTTCTRDTTHLAEIAQRMQSTCTDNDCIAAEWCEKVGRYYTLMENGGLSQDLIDTICPRGWHIPSKEEWEILGKSVDNVVPRVISENAYSTMDSIRAYDYQKKGGPVDACGFSAIFAGYYYFNGSLEEFFENSHYWSSSRYDEVTTYSMAINEIFDFIPIRTKQSIRCIRD